MPYQLGQNFKLFTLNSNPELAQEIADELGCELGKSSIKHFSDGEVQINIEESVRGKDIYLIQSTSQPGNEHVMELLIMIDALKRASAEAINVVIPYYGYARQDRKASSREPITAKLVANMLETAGATHIITMDLHASQMQGFFKCPVDNLVAEPLLAKWITRNIPDWQEAVVVSKNPGGSKRVTSMADALKLSFGIITTERRRPYMCNSMMASAILDPIPLDGHVFKGVFEHSSELLERWRFSHQL